MIAVDLDGTLLDSGSAVPQANRDALRAALDAGFHVCISTGRGIHSTTPIVAGICPERIPLVLRNGSIVFGSLRGEIWSRNMMPGPLARAAAAAYQAAGLRPVVCIEDGPEPDTYLMDPTGMPEEERQFYHGFHPMIREGVGIFNSPFNQASCIGSSGDPDVLEQVRRHILEELKLEMNMHIFSLPEGVHYLEGHFAGISKWFGIEQVLKRNGVAPEEVIAVGDAINDFAMIRDAGLGVVMANGDERCKQVADVEAPSNDECGVAWVVERFLLS